MDSTIQQKIKELRDFLNNNADAEEDSRVKAIVNTKLEEAELWATKIYTK